MIEKFVGFIIWNLEHPNPLTGFIVIAIIVAIMFGVIKPKTDYSKADVSEDD